MKQFENITNNSLIILRNQPRHSCKARSCLPAPHRWHKGGSHSSQTTSAFQRALLARQARSLMTPILRCQEKIRCSNETTEPSSSLPPSNWNRLLQEERGALLRPDSLRPDSLRFSFVAGRSWWSPSAPPRTSSCRRTSRSGWRSRTSKSGWRNRISKSGRRRRTLKINSERWLRLLRASAIATPGRINCFPVVECLKLKKGNENLIYMKKTTN